MKHYRHKKKTKRRTKRRTKQNRTTRKGGGFFDYFRNKYTEYKNKKIENKKKKDENENKKKCEECSKLNCDHSNEESQESLVRPN